MSPSITLEMQSSLAALKERLVEADADPTHTAVTGVIEAARSVVRVFEGVGVVLASHKRHRWVVDGEFPLGRLRETFIGSPGVVAAETTQFKSYSVDEFQPHLFDPQVMESVCWVAGPEYVGTVRLRKYDQFGEALETWEAARAWFERPVLSECGDSLSLTLHYAVMTAKDL